jgi:sulfate/thiosulfate-binding protein
MKKTIKAAAAASVTAVLALTGCSASGGSDSGETISLNAFSVMEAANVPVIEDFQGTDGGDGVTFKTSYGASGDQSRAVVSGADADVVHYSLETDVTRLVGEGLVAEDWKDNATNGIATSSVVVFVVRKGNPEGIETWDDIVESGVDIITPNPGSSGSARWNILAAYGHVLADGGSDADAEAYLEQFFEHVVALPGGGRDATTAFTGGTGDVLISYENEAILARQGGEDFDYIVPDQTLLIENPGAVLEDADPRAESYRRFVVSKEGQTIFAEKGFRPLVDGIDVEVEGANDPSDPFPEPKTLLTITDDFGGWAEASKKYFDEDTGLVTKIQEETGNS